MGRGPESILEASKWIDYRARLYPLLLWLQPNCETNSLQNFTVNIQSGRRILLVDNDIQQLVEACQTCANIHQLPLWCTCGNGPPRPWQIIHLHYAVSFQGSNFLIAVKIIKSTTAVKTYEVLQGMFAWNGLPEEVVMDNGPQFVSEELSAFMRENGVKHIRCAPYHPASNSLAKRFVTSMKTALKTNFKSLPSRLANFLLTYSSSPHATTKTAPCSLILHRPLRTPLNLLLSDRHGQVVRSQSRKKTHMTRKQGFVNSWLAKECWQETYVVERIGYLPQWSRELDLCPTWWRPRITSCGEETRRSVKESLWC